MGTTVTTTPHTARSIDGASHKSSAATRRDVIKLLGGAALTSALVAAPSVRTMAQQSTRSVIVLGAGMAGLSAALALSRLGHRVTVIEYQNRIGGRLLSVPLKGGQFTEAGGGHFRSNMPYVLSYIRHFKLPVLSLNDGLPRYFVDGQFGTGADLASWPWPLSAEERNVSVSSSLNRYLFRAGLDTDSVLEFAMAHAGSAFAVRQRHGRRDD